MDIVQCGDNGFASGCNGVGSNAMPNTLYLNWYVNTSAVDYWSERQSKKTLSVPGNCAQESLIWFRTGAENGATLTST